MAPNIRLLSPTAAIAVLVVAGRLMAALVTVLVASVVIFLLVNALPADTAIAALGHESTHAQREQYRHLMHLDDPPVVRYTNWLTGIVRGDFGASTVSGQPIAADLALRFRYTAALTTGALLLSLLLALPLAVFSATRAGGRIDTILSAAAVSVVALPEYVLALVLLIVFGAELQWLPTLSLGIANGDLLGYVMPILTLGVITSGYVYRSARINLIEAINAPYVRAAVLHGYSSPRVLWLHVMPNAISSVLNVIGLNLIYVFGGVIVVEAVFAYPGLGTLLISAINNKDYPVVAAVALIMSFWIVAVNTVIDAAVLFLNPRLRTRQAQ